MSSRTGLADPRFLPSLEDVARTAERELIDNDLIGELGFSLMRQYRRFSDRLRSRRQLRDFCWRSAPCRQAGDADLQRLDADLLLAWIPLISVWFGFGEQAKIVFVALASFIPIVLNTYDGMRDAPDDRSRSGAPEIQRPATGLRIYLPQPCRRSQRACISA